MNNVLHQTIQQLLNNAERILLISHIRPDGDAVGSILGLGLSLQALDKDVQMVLVDGVPLNFRHLPGSDQIRYHPNGEFDLSVVLDCSDIERTGNVLIDQMPDINIDHHITNKNFARINLVEPNVVATAAIIADHLNDWNLHLTKPTATSLLNGIISDTLGFRTSNVTPHTLRMAANLVEHGANLSKIYHKALVQRSFEAARFWGIGLEHLQRRGRLIWTTFTLDDRLKVAYPGQDDADLVNMLTTINDCDIAVIFVEKEDNHVKVSWRAKPDWDISKIATQFGGGGHPAAAGADIIGNLENVQQQVLVATQSILNNNHSTIDKERPSFVEQQ